MSHLEANRRCLLVAGLLAGSGVGFARASDRESAMIHQLRVYEIFDGNKAAFHARFRDHAMPIMKRHGFDIVALWEARGERGPEFVYLLRWPDQSTLDSRWAAFMADQEWSRIKNETAAKHGRLVGAITSRTMRLADYSTGI